MSITRDARLQCIVHEPFESSCVLKAIDDIDTHVMYRACRPEGVRFCAVEIGGPPMHVCLMDLIDDIACWNVNSVHPPGQLIAPLVHHLCFVCSATPLWLYEHARSLVELQASHVFDQPDGPHQIPHCTSPASGARATPPPRLYDLSTYLIQFGARKDSQSLACIGEVFNPNCLRDATETGQGMSTRMRHANSHKKSVSPLVRPLVPVLLCVATTATISRTAATALQPAFP